MNVMGYSDVIRYEQRAVVTDMLESTGIKFWIGFKRPASCLGWGWSHVVANHGSPATDAVIALNYDSAAAASVQKDSASPLDAALLGVTVERSELMRGRSPVAPNAVFSAFDVVENDLVNIEVTTAETAGTAGEELLYVLLAPRGSL